MRFTLFALLACVALTLTGCGSGGGGDASVMPNSSHPVSLHGVEFDPVVCSTVAPALVAPFGSFTATQVDKSNGAASAPQRLQCVVTSGTDTIAGIPTTTTSLEWWDNISGSPVRDGKSTFWLATATDNSVYLLKKVDVQADGSTVVFDLSAEGSLLVQVAPSAATIGTKYFWFVRPMFGQPPVAAEPTATSSGTVGTLISNSDVSPSGVHGCMHLRHRISASDAAPGGFEAWVHPTFGLVEWQANGTTWFVRPGVVSNG